MPLLSCAGKRPANLGISDSALAPCPSSPNCVSSDAPEGAHQVAPFQLALPADEAWQAVQAAVAELPRTRIVSETGDYLHAECRSAIFGFVDDLELHRASSPCAPPLGWATPTWESTAAGSKTCEPLSAVGESSVDKRVAGGHRAARANPGGAMT
jgi:hypothetical protein